MGGFVFGVFWGASPLGDIGTKASPLKRRATLRAILWYTCTVVPTLSVERIVEVERVQTGVRIEKRLLKVLKGLAELKDMTLGDLLEGIVLHAFEGRSAFSPQTLADVKQLRKLYGLTLRAADSHHLKERK
jgi:hypothetical protein